ncbi:MAG: magnesium transporter [Bdellovibrionales bacterium]
MSEGVVTDQEINLHEPIADMVDLSDERISDITAQLETDDKSVAKKIFQEELSAVNTAAFLSKITNEDRQKYLEKYPKYIQIESYLHLSEDLLRDVLDVLSPSDIAYIIRDLESDDALDIITLIEDDRQTEVIKKLSKKTRVVVEEGLSFPEDSAGRLMQREFVSVPQFWTAGKTIDYLRAAKDELPDDFFDIIVVSPTYHVLGEVPLNNLVRANRKEKVEDLMLETPHPIPVEMDQEDVAKVFQREDLSSAPVIDEDGRLIGAIMVDDVIDVIQEEAQEDILKMGGVGQDDLYRAVLSTTRSRFSWLFINLITAILASIVISFFEGTIQQIVALAVLMPIVASMGGNAGTQALTVAVRAIATNEISDTNALRIIWKESLVGLLNGIAFAIISGGITALWFDDPALGAVIGSAMVINLITAGLFGSMIPIVLNKLNLDPALASTVVLTTLTDIIGFLAFLGLAAAFIL